MSKTRAPKTENVDEPKTETVAENVEEPKERTFVLPAIDDEDAVTRVSVGASPRVSIGAGETFATTDPRLADRLAAQPELEEVTR